MQSNSNDTAGKSFALMNQNTDIMHFKTQIGNLKVQLFSADNNNSNDNHYYYYKECYIYSHSSA